MTTATIPQANNVEMLATLLHSLSTGASVDIAPRHRSYYLSALKYLGLCDVEGHPVAETFSNRAIAQAMAASDVVRWFDHNDFETECEARGLGSETIARRAATARAWSEFVKTHGHVEVKAHLQGVVARYHIGRTVTTRTLCPNCYIALPAAKVSECGYCGQEL